MAETLISPGVLARENDQSFITQQPVTVGAAIIGPTVKGPVEVPTIVTSYSDYLNKFGSTFVTGGQVYTYFTSIAAYNYFNNGGETLLVARIVNGTYSEATSTAISGSTTAPNQPTLVLKTISEGTIMNSSSSLDASGALLSGSADNVRWQIVNSNTSSGTFDLLIRQGNDNTNTPIVLETWTNLSMDPLAPNFVSRVIGDQALNFASSGTSYYLDVTGSYPNNSRYVYVSAVNNPTPNYFDNNGIAKAQFTGSIPLNASGSFNNATGTISTDGQYYSAITDGNKSQGIPSASYNNMINLLSNQDDYRFNVLLTPGLFNSLQTSQVTSIISNTQNRGDNIFVLDLVPYNSSVSTISTQALSRNTSYAASYWPWLQVIDPDTG